MKKILFALSALLALAAADAQDNPRLIPFWNDATTEISTNKTYTHAVSFGSANRTPVVNLVPFFYYRNNNNTAVPATGNMPAPRARYGWQNFPPTAHDGGLVANNVPSGVMRVNGLKPGFIRVFNATWIHIGTSDATVNNGNRLRLAGGEVSCGGLRIHPANRLEVVLGLGGILPAEVSSRPNFLGGSKTRRVQEDPVVVAAGPS